MINFAAVVFQRKLSLCIDIWKREKTWLESEGPITSFVEWASVCVCLCVFDEFGIKVSRKLVFVCYSPVWVFCVFTVHPCKWQAAWLWNNKPQKALESGIAKGKGFEAHPKINAGCLSKQVLGQTVMGANCEMCVWCRTVATIFDSLPMYCGWIWPDAR